MGIWTTAPEENCPPRLEVGFGLGLALELGLGGGEYFPRGNCPRTLIMHLNIF